MIINKILSARMKSITRANPLKSSSCDIISEFNCNTKCFINPAVRSGGVFSCASWVAAVPAQVMPDRERKEKGGYQKKCPLLRFCCLQMIAAPYGHL